MTQPPSHHTAAGPRNVRPSGAWTTAGGLSPVLARHPTRPTSSGAGPNPFNFTLSSATSPVLILGHALAPPSGYNSLLDCAYGHPWRGDKRWGMAAHFKTGDFVIY